MQFSLEDVELGVEPEAIIEEIRKNLSARPELLEEFARVVTDNTAGFADFVYVHEQGEDWLFFVLEEDIPYGEDDQPSRPYDYARPGFFADAELSQKLSRADTEVQGILPREVTRSDYDLGNGTYRLVLASAGVRAQWRFTANPAP